jgi:23S rRNA (uracil1939-C5)-methyltransferase
LKPFNKPADYKAGDRLQVKIEKIVPKGFGLAFAPGLTVFVALAAPGDIVEIELRQLKKNVAFAEVVNVVEPSPVRTTPPCPYFGACGGCDFQQMTYKAQLDSKAAIIRDCLQRIGKIDYQEEIPMVASPLEFDYRLRAQWHCDTGNKHIGYFRRETHDVIDVDHCPIATPTLNRALQHLRETIDWGSIWSNRIEVEAAHGDDGEVSWYSNELNEKTNEISVNVRGEKYLFSAQTFFQGNQYLIEKLIELAIDGFAGDTALDLFCGVGLFSLPLARKFKNVIAVESSDLSIDFAEKNAANAALTNIDFRRQGVEEFVMAYKGNGPDLVVFDPPRAGTSKDTILRMLALAPKAISYVSCEPSVLARDLMWMAERGYAVASITGVDLFPQTHHVETIVRLNRL